MPYEPMNGNRTMWVVVAIMLVGGVILAGLLMYLL
jgi:hypothetical protein